MGMSIGRQVQVVLRASQSSRGHVSGTFQCRSHTQIQAMCTHCTITMTVTCAFRTQCTLTRRAPHLPYRHPCGDDAKLAIMRTELAPPCVRGKQGHYLAKMVCVSKTYNKAKPIIHCISECLAICFLCRSTRGLLFPGSISLSGSEPAADPSCLPWEPGGQRGWHLLRSLFRAMESTDTLWWTIGCSLCPTVVPPPVRRDWYLEALRGTTHSGLPLWRRHGPN